MRPLATLVLLALACTPIQPQPAPTYDCSTVCAHGQALDCDWARWTPLSNCITSCAEWRDTFFYDMQCLSTVATCEDAEHCMTSRLHFEVK